MATSTNNLSNVAINTGTSTATAALQTTGNTSLSSIVNNTNKQADNSAVGTGLPTVIGKYDAVPRTLTTGNVGYIALDVGGAEVVGNSNKPTYSYSLFGIAPTTSTWNALTIAQPASPTKTIYIKRITILSVGTFTAAQLTKISLIRQTTAATVGDGTITWMKRDNSDTPTAIGRYGAAVSITLGTTTTTDYVVAYYAGTALSTIQPIEFDLTNNGSLKGFIIPKTANYGVAFQIAGGAGGAGLAIEVEFTEE